MTQSLTDSPRMPTYRTIIALAIPVFIANLALPLQGAIDVAVMGHQPDSSYLAGLGIAAQLWVMMLVSFNFLQYASSGLSAQASGCRTTAHELPAILLRSLFLAGVLALGLWVLKPWLIGMGLSALGSTGDNQMVANQYVQMRFYGVFFELANYAFIGWLAGQGKTRQLMWVQLSIALTNIVLTLLFVYGFDLAVMGVALGTVLGYATGFVLASWLAWGNCKEQVKQSVHASVQTGASFVHQIFNRDMLRLFLLNKDIFIRTVLLTLSFAWITRLSALQGDTVMATNALLLQVLTISAFALDGVAVATESLVGKAVHQTSPSHLRHIMHKTGRVIMMLAGVLSLIWWGMLPVFVQAMTTIDTVQHLALDYRLVVALLPLIGAGAYWIDGVMFGLTAGKQIRNGAILVAVLFFPVTWWLYAQFGDSHAMPVIWFAVYFLLLARFGVLILLLNKRLKTGNL